MGRQVGKGEVELRPYFLTGSSGRGSSTGASGVVVGLSGGSFTGMGGFSPGGFGPDSSLMLSQMRDALRV